MLISDRLIQYLEENAIFKVFGYPGLNLLPIYESLRKSNITHYFFSHEQLAINAACGYATIIKQPSVCFVTAGPGSTNTVTAIANAFKEKIPLVIIAGNISTNLLNLDTFQDIPIVKIVKPITAYSKLIVEPKNFLSIFKQAMELAYIKQQPVFLSVCHTVLLSPAAAESHDLICYKNTLPYKKMPNNFLTNIKKLNPLVIVGKGCRQSAINVAGFVINNNLRCVFTPGGAGIIPSDYEQNFGLLRNNGNFQAITVTAKTKHLLVLGCSLDPRTTGKNFNKKIIQIDINPKPNTHIIPNALICSDLGYFFKEFILTTKEYKSCLPDRLLAKPLNGKITYIDLMEYISKQKFDTLILGMSWATITSPPSGHSK